MIKSSISNIESMYSTPGRYYHTMKHIHDCLVELESVKDLINSYELVETAIYYHDIIYDPTRDDNEELSAELALEELSLVPDFAVFVKEMILTTKTHTPRKELSTDNLYFLDIDLSILGKSPEEYKEYEENIRKEYEDVPVGIYHGERGKIMRKFLKRDNIYFTEYFQNKYEDQARKNLEVWK